MRSKLRNVYKTFFAGQELNESAKRKIAVLDPVKVVVTNYHFGLNRRTSPHFVKTFPGIVLPIMEQGNTWVEGWNFGHALFDALPTYEAFSAYPIAICGARGCIISCMNHLEKRKRIKNTFKRPFTEEKPWMLEEKPEKFHEDHNGFVYDPEDKEGFGGNVQSDWY